MRMYQARFFPQLPVPWLFSAAFTLRLALLYFQGDGGGGAPPIFQGDGGGGAPPIFQGDGGGGAPPMDAVNVVPSLCAATTVFRPIAATRINIAARKASLRDMVPPRARKTRSHSILYGTEVKHPLTTDLFQIDTHQPAPCFRQTFARLSSGHFTSKLTLESWHCTVNGTVVLSVLGLPGGNAFPRPPPELEWASLS